MLVYLGLGSNLGDREGLIRHAIMRLAALGQVLALAPLYETEPWGYLAQPRFLNTACAVQTDLTPLPLLHALKQIERELGRVPTIRNGPRTIDIDILLYGDQQVDLPGLTVPHPGMLERATVLVPLADIAPQLRHPLSGTTVLEHLQKLKPVSGIAHFPPGLGHLCQDRR